MSSKKNITAAVIGCGNIGAGVSNYADAVRPGSHADAYRQNEHVDLVGLVEPGADRQAYLKEEYNDVSVYGSIDELFSVGTPDVVSVASPTAMHYEHVMVVAKHKPKVILCEKPLAYDLDQAKEMVETCKELGITLLVNHQRHFDTVLRSWAKKIQDGLLGDVYQGNAFYYNGFFNNGTHLVDALRMFLGDVLRVQGEYNERTSSADDKNIDGALHFARGTRVTLHSLTKNYGHFGFVLYGEKGRLEVTNLGFEVRYQEKVDNKHFPGYFELSDNVIVEGEPRSMIKETIAHVVSHLQDSVPPIGTGEDGLMVMNILDSFKQSAEDEGVSVSIQ